MADTAVHQDDFQTDEETSLWQAYNHAAPKIDPNRRGKGDDDYRSVLQAMAVLRGPLDAFLDNVRVNTPEPELRRNRLALLWQTRALMRYAADFSKIGE